MKTYAAVSLDTLMEALVFTSAGASFEHQAFLCTESGLVHFYSEFGDDEEPLPDDIDHPGKYIELPHKNDLELGRPLALQFTSDVLPEDLDVVRGMFRRPGAYANFKNLLEQRDKLQQWYEYENTACQNALREWCISNGINIEG